MAPVIARGPLIRAAQNRIFNVGADQPYTVRELAERVAEAMGVRLRVVHLPSRQGVCLDFSDHSACQRFLGIMPQTPLREVLQRRAIWVKSVGPRTTKEFGRNEIPRALPPSGKPIEKKDHD